MPFRWWNFWARQRIEVPIQIFGTDLSETSIQRARAGFFKESIEADVEPLRLRRFFHRNDGGYQISKTIRDMCIFSTQNIFNDPPFSRMDLVSCRNVMIYLSQALQKRVIPVFHYALNPTGFLMIGNTEGLLGAGSELFEMAEKKQKIYRKKLVATPVTFAFPVVPPPQEAAAVEPPACCAVKQADTASRAAGDPARSRSAVADPVCSSRGCGERAAGYPADAADAPVRFWSLHPAKRA